MEPSSPAASRPPEQPSSEPGTVAVQRASRLADLVEENERPSEGATVVAAQDRVRGGFLLKVGGVSLKLYPGVSCVYPDVS